MLTGLDIPSPPPPKGAKAARTPCRSPLMGSSARGITRMAMRFRGLEPRQTCLRMMRVLLAAAATECGGTVWTRGRSVAPAVAGWLQVLHLVEGARDANRLPAEIDRHRARLHPGDTAHPIHVMTHPVVDRILLDCWLGLGLEGAKGEMSPPCP